MDKKDIFYDDKENVDIRTDFGKGITYKSLDGKEWATMAQVEAQNKILFDSIIVKKESSLQSQHEEQPKHHR